MKPRTRINVKTVLSGIGILIIRIRRSWKWESSTGETVFLYWDSNWLLNSHSPFCYPRRLDQCGIWVQIMILSNELSYPLMPSRSQKNVFLTIMASAWVKATYTILCQTLAMNLLHSGLMLSTGRNRGSCSIWQVIGRRRQGFMVLPGQLTGRAYKIPGPKDQTQDSYICRKGFMVMYLQVTLFQLPQQPKLFSPPYIKLNLYRLCGGWTMWMHTQPRLLVSVLLWKVVSEARVRVQHLARKLSIVEIYSAVPL